MTIFLVAPLAACTVSIAFFCSFEFMPARALSAAPLSVFVAAILVQDRLGDALSTYDSNVASRSFESCGMTPTQYFLKARLQRARHLLQYSTLSVTEIAVVTGFASISHFTRRYAELYGRTPTAERGRPPRRAPVRSAVHPSGLGLVAA